MSMITSNCPYHNLPFNHDPNGGAWVISNPLRLQVRQQNGHRRSSHIYIRYYKSLIKYIYEDDEPNYSAAVV